MSSCRATNAKLQRWAAEWSGKTPAETAAPDETVAALAEIRDVAAAGVRKPSYASVPVGGVAKPDIRPEEVLFAYAIAGKADGQKQIEEVQDAVNALRALRAAILASPSDLSRSRDAKIREEVRARCVSLVDWHADHDADLSALADSMRSMPLTGKAEP